MTNEISVVFRNSSNYDYHFSIKKLVKEFEGQFECFGGNTENYKTFSVGTGKEILKSSFHKDGNVDILTITYKMNLLKMLDL